MKVKTIDPKNTEVSGALGISAERKKELDELIEGDTHRELAKSKDGTGTVVDQMERLTMYSKHPNETAYICFRIGTTIGSLRVLGDLGSLGTLLLGGKL